MNSLKDYLLTNAVFSGVSGLLMIVFNQSFFMDYFGVHHVLVFPVIGAGLLLFSLLVLNTAKQKVQNKRLVWLISMLDSAWVLGSFAIVFFDLFQIAPKSHNLILFVALWIAILATGQFYYLNRGKKKQLVNV